MDRSVIARLWHRRHLSVQPPGPPRRPGRGLLITALGGLVAVLATVPAVGNAASQDSGNAADSHASSTASTPAVVRTTAGSVRGNPLPYTTEFLGVPYAADPTGSLRWQPPAPVRQWSGVRNATAEPPNCPQLATIDPGLTEDSVNEDCLALDVVTPATWQPQRPVYVFIHGGGFKVGHLGFENMTQFVQKTGAVAVTINYRLGALGFLDLPGLTASDGGGNFGILDQQAALRWVQTNIGRFGGDPSNVTIGGQSAGGSAVCTQLNSPSAKGLFAKAVLESGSCNSTRTHATVTEQSMGFAAKLGCTVPAKAATCLRGKSVPAIIAADGTTTGGWGPEIGTPVQPRAATESFTSGQFNKVPVIIGSNGADSTGTTCSVQSLAGLLARHVPTYRYNFDDESAPPLPGRTGAAGGSGAQHSAELAYLYLFNGIQAPLNAAQQRLADSMILYWNAFLHTGRPQDQRLPAWPAFSASHPQVATFTATGTSIRTDLSEQYGCA